jgi:anti-sigma B factor antagonist
MIINEIKNNGVCILGIEGRLDTTNYGVLESKLMSLLDGGETRIIMDCSKMEYISSSGLRVFLLGLKKAKLLNGIFLITELQDTIMEIFEIAGFTSIFEIFRTKDEAMARMGAGM